MAGAEIHAALQSSPSEQQTATASVEECKERAKDPREAEVDDLTEVHLRVSCDGCKQCPIIGDCYKCTVQTMIFALFATSSGMLLTQCTYLHGHLAARNVPVGKSLLRNRLVPEKSIDNLATCLVTFAIGHSTMGCDCRTRVEWITTVTNTLRRNG